MPLFGSHLSIAGGFVNAVYAAERLGCQTLQIFTSAPRVWPVRSVPPTKKASPLSKNDKPTASEEARLFRRAARRARLRFPMAHDSYLINLASPDDRLYRRSVEAFVIEIERAELLGLRYLVMHPGAHVDSGEEAGLARVAAALDEVHARCPRFRLRVLLETTAGQGSCLGHRFEQLAKILASVAQPERLGVCFDTCHALAAGYELAPLPAYRATMRAFDRAIGLKRLRAFHVNDSLKPLGSRVDRHAHIGQGHLGLEPFRLLVNDRRFRNRPMVLETPKEDDMDTVNLALLRGLVEDGS